MDRKKSILRYLERGEVMLLRVKFVDDSDFGIVFRFAGLSEALEFAYYLMLSPDVVLSVVVYAET